MISLAPGIKVFLACRPVDLRNGFDGLASKAQQVSGADPFSGHLFRFCCNVWRWVVGHLRERPVHLSSGDLK